MAATETDDPLAALDALDATIGDPRSDDDDALEAYEELIALAAAPEREVVLSKAAQLLARHFARFPHVHANVLDALLELCARGRPQAVRINALRSLIALAKAPTSALAPDARERVHAAVAALASTETSGIVTRTMNELGKALLEELPRRAEKKTPAKSEADFQVKTLATAARAAAESVGAESERPMTRRVDTGDHDLRETLNESREERRTREDEATDKRAASDVQKRRAEELLGRPPNSPARVPNGPCPPGPYIHLANVPVGARPPDIAQFLSEVDPDIKSYSVHTKLNPGGASMYAFASLSTTRLALEAIRFTKEVKFRNSYLVANFARGPACKTITFAWRSEKGWSLDRDGALRLFDFSRCKSVVWSRLCDAMRTFGDFEVVTPGKIRFRAAESAREAMKTSHFTIHNFDFTPVYSLEEQLENDATRWRLETPSARQSFALKSGRVVGDREPEGKHDSLGVGERDALGSGRERESRDRDYDKLPSEERRSSWKREPSPGGEDRRSWRRSPSPRARQPNSDRRLDRSKSKSRSGSPSALKLKAATPKARQEPRGDRRSHSHSPAPTPRKRQSRGHSRSPSASPARKHESRKQKRERSPSKSPSRRPESRSSRDNQLGRPPSRSVSPGAAPASSRKQDAPWRRSRSPSFPLPKKSREMADYPASPSSSRPARPSFESRRRSNSPRSRERTSREPSVSTSQRMLNDGRGSERSQARRGSRSRSSERERFVPRGMGSFGSAGSRIEVGRPGRESGPRDMDRAFDRPRPPPERRDGGLVNLDDVSRYGPAVPEPPSDRPSYPLRDDRNTERQATRRDFRGSPPRQQQQFPPPMSRGSPRSEQRRRSRSVPRSGDVRGRSRSPRRRSRSPPRGDRGRSRSPPFHRGSRPGESGPPSDNGMRGRDPPIPPMERKTSAAFRRNDDRSIAEVARDELEERERYLQQLRRESHPPPSPAPSKYGDGGREHTPPFPPLPPPSRDERPRGGSFSKHRSRSRSPVGRPGLPPPPPPPLPPHMRELSRVSGHSPVPPHMRDFSRSGHSPIPPHARDFSRTAGNFKAPPPFEPPRGGINSQSTRGDSPRAESRRGSNSSIREQPQFEPKRREIPPFEPKPRDRRDLDGGRGEERHGRSPPPPPMGGSGRRGPAPPLMERHRSKSRERGGDRERGRERDRDRGRDRDYGRERARESDRKSEKDRGARQQQRPAFGSSDDQNNRNRANHQEGSPPSRSEASALEVAASSSPTGKRLRSLTPSPVRRDGKPSKRSARERSRSPMSKRMARSDADVIDEPPSEKKPRIEDEDAMVLPKPPPTAAAFDDMDEMMVDYEED